MAGNGGSGFQNGLITKDEIDVSTDHGSCKIQLTYGSVTKLAKEDGVDVLVVSAFPNNYVETPWSVIGALKRDLGISVHDLSLEKEEDLRSIFSCWWSKELPEDKSFRRILCFEGSYKPGARPTTVIGEIFRCLVSLSKGSEIKVMMPMVTTGHQGSDFETILSLLVEAAIHWMEIGLLLRLLKIVVYTKDLKQIKNDPMINCFAALKQTCLKEQAKKQKIDKIHPLEYDVYLSYCPQDQSIAERVIAQLSSLYNDIVIFAERQEIDPEKTWQDQIYKVMLTCARIVTVITPFFLSDESCLEQYNIALCCTRNMKRDYLAPLYVETIETMPTYMSLIQYIDCRPFSEEAVKHACSIVTSWLESNIPKLKKKSGHVGQKLVKSPLLLGDHYDVFISYSHVNSEIAHLIKDHLSTLHTDWKIFIDVADLKTGVVWQTKLYNSIERSNIVVCLISPTYIASKVCQEEYNLAMALSCDQAYGTVLFPILVEPVDTLPTWCMDYPPLDMTKTHTSTFLAEVNLLKALHNLWMPRIMATTRLTAEWREKLLEKDFSLLPNINRDALENFRHSKKTKQVDERSPHIVLCYHKNQKRLANFFAKRLSLYMDKPVIEVPKDSADGKSVIDKADLVILFLSPAFVETPILVEEANVALCRQRWTDRMILLPLIVEPLPSSPAYFKLFLCLFAITDEIWEDSDVPLITRLSWCSTLSSKSCKFLDTAALFASFVATKSDCVKGAFKTLLSSQELARSVKEMSALSEESIKRCNPMTFEDYKPKFACSHSVQENEVKDEHPATASHKPEDSQV